MIVLERSHLGEIRTPWRNNKTLALASILGLQCPSAILILLTKGLPFFLQCPFVGTGVCNNCHPQPVIFRDGSVSSRPHLVEDRAGNFVYCFSFSARFLVLAGCCNICHPQLGKIRESFISSRSYPVKDRDGEMDLLARLLGRLPTYHDKVGSWKGSFGTLTPMAPPNLH